MQTEDVKHCRAQTNREHQVKAEDGKQEECPTLEGDMDALTQEEFLNRLTHVCRYDKLIKPETEGPLQIFIQLDLRHIEAIEQLVKNESFYLQKFQLKKPKYRAIH